MSRASYKRNRFRIFHITYSVFDKKGTAVSYKNTASQAIKDVRERIIWSRHPTFKITKVECKEY